MKSNAYVTITENHYFHIKHVISNFAISYENAKSAKVVIFANHDITIEFTLLCSIQKLQSFMSS